MRKSNGLADKIGTFGCIVIMLIGFVIIGYLFYLAGFSTSVINGSEHTWLIGDSFWVNMLWGIALVGVGGFVCHRTAPGRAFIQRVNTDSEYYELCRKRMLILLGSLCIVILLVLQKIPVNDQRTVCDIVNSMMNHDYYQFERGGYIDEYPNQLGMVLFLYGIAQIFGSYNYLIFQLLNVIALVGIYYTMSQLSDWMGHSAFTGICILGMGFIFLPGILYTTFVYGTLIGLCLSLLAFKNTLKLFLNEDNWTDRNLVQQLLHKGLRLVVILLESWIAVVFKQNYMINVIALIIMIVLLTLRQRRNVMVTVQAILLILALSVMLLFSGRVVTKVAEKVTGMDIGSGISSLSWVAMGLQENADRYDGWYNGYNVNSYHEMNSSKERQEPVVVEYLQERMQEFAENPEDAISFFSGKNASQWNNPDFQIFWCLNGMRNSINYSRGINCLFSEKGVDIMDRILNRVQFIILLGAVLYCLLRNGRGARRNGTIAEVETEGNGGCIRNEIWDSVPIYYITVLIGGFLFHSFWEAKAQYTFPYFMLLIPVSMYGYEAFGTAFVRGADSGKCAADGKLLRKERFCNWLRNPAIIVMACLLLVGAAIYAGGSKCELVKTLFLRTEGTEAYQQYLREHEYAELEEGEYTIAPVDGENEDEKISVRISTSNYDPKCWITTEDDQTYMADDSTIRYSSDKVFPLEVSGVTYVDEQSWYLRKADQEDEYYLIHVEDAKELALTRNIETGNVELTYYEGNENQRWRIVEK